MPKYAYIVTLDTFSRNMPLKNAYGLARDIWLFPAYSLITTLSEYLLFVTIQNIPKEQESVKLEEVWNMKCW